ncbi:hypothetical protein [Nocardia sp. XZ_19_231]|uniref:hypothetical protein n=1 Tax=Nocardia sp. XZ_19_231 TaxID=2769252 RepID=UPI0018905D3F|nr:hypothetical protein [Nocardia sp. XZ_19_231]
MTRDDVLIGNSRVAYGEDGGAQQWVDVVGSASVYADQDSANSNQYTQVFNSGSPTSGTPDNVLGTLPDLKTTFTLVDNGVPVGSLEQIDAEPGLYHTAYINKDGDISVWRTNETEQGGLVTNPINYLDHTGRGWYGGILSGGPLWEVTPKLDGSSLFTNTELTNSGTHVRVWDPGNETRSDKFYSNSGTGGYLAATNANGTTIDGDDGSHTRYDRLGKLIESRGPTKKDPKPDLRSNYERFTSFSRDVATGFEAAYSETKTGIIALLGQQDRDDGIAENWPGAPKLAYRLWASAMDGSLKDAWLGLATSGVGIGAGLAFTAIDLAAISVGQGSWGQLRRDILGTGNEVSIFAIGADWTQAGEAPGETIGRGLFGSMLLLGPKGIHTATGRMPPPSTINAALQTAANTALRNSSAGLGKIGRYFGEPALDVANVRSFPSAARVTGPISFAADVGGARAGVGPGRTANVDPNPTPGPAHESAPSSRVAEPAPLLPGEMVSSGARDAAGSERVVATESSATVADGADRTISSRSSPLIYLPEVVPTGYPLVVPGNDAILPGGVVLFDALPRKNTNGTVDFYPDLRGDPLAAIAVLDVPAVYEKSGIGNKKPVGFIDGIDHRSHMIPESGVQNAADVNVPENSIAEHGSLNMGPKRRWENAAKRYAISHPGVVMVSVVLDRDLITRRPIRVRHSLVDPTGREVEGFTVVMYNSIAPGRAKVVTVPPNPVYPK